MPGQALEHQENLKCKRRLKQMALRQVLCANNEETKQATNINLYPQISDASNQQTDNQQAGYCKADSQSYQSERFCQFKATSE